MVSPADVFDEISAGGNALRSTVEDLLRQILIAKKDGHPLLILPQQHPLGFLCIRWNLDLNRSVRIHIWNRKFNWTQSPNWPIHDHIFSFKSAVLAGLIQNKTYEQLQMSNRRTWNLFEVEYSSQCSKLIPQSRAVALRIFSASLQPTGSAYELPAGVLHRSTLRSDVAITALATTTEPALTLKPRVVGALTQTALEFDRSTSQARDTDRIIESAVLLLHKKTPEE